MSHPSLLVLRLPVPGIGIVPRGTQDTVFDQMFWVFTVLGTLISVVVIGYLVWQAYQYRASNADADEDEVVRPRLGELPASSHGGRHLLFSFSISAVVVISLVAWSYGSLLYLQGGVNDDPPTSHEQMNVTVVGHQFYWEFDYHNGSGPDKALTTQGELRVPKDALINLDVTSADVFHNFGIPALKVKADAIPGRTTSTWLATNQTGTYLARCYELCGAGHSQMTANVSVMKRDAFEAWYANQTTNATQTNQTTNATQTNQTTNATQTNQTTNATQTNATTAGA